MNNKKIYSIVMPTIQEEPKQYEYIKWTVIYGLATRKHIHKTIENTYNLNRAIYYQAFKKSEYNSFDLSRFTTETSEMFIKVAAIMAYSEEENNYKEIFSFIEKGFKFSWKYLKRHERLNLPDFYNEIKIESRTDESNYQAVMGLFISSIKGYEFVVDLDELPNGLTEEIEGSTIAMAQVFLFAKSNYDNMFLKNSKEENKLSLLEKDYINKQLKNWEVKNEDLSLMQLLRNYKNISINSQLDNNLRPLEYFKKLDRGNEEIYFSENLRTFSIINEWLETENISHYDFHENYKLTHKSFGKIASFVYKLIQNEIINEKEERMYISFLLTLDSFKEAYKETQNYYYTNRVEDVEYIAFEKELILEKEWLSKEQQWKVREKELKDKLRKVEVEKNNWKKEAEGLRKKRSILESELEQASEKEKDFEALRKYLAFKEIEEDESISMSIIEEYLKSKKIYIIGGNPSWQKKLKIKLPDFIIWDADDVNRDFSSLTQADAVCLCWTYMSHPMFWKVKKQVNKHNLPLIYTGNHKNYEKTIIEIYKNLISI